MEAPPDGDSAAARLVQHRERKEREAEERRQRDAADAAEERSLTEAAAQEAATQETAARAAAEAAMSPEERIAAELAAFQLKYRDLQRQMQETEHENVTLKRANASLTDGMGAPGVATSQQGADGEQQTPLFRFREPARRPADVMRPPAAASGSGTVDGGTNPATDPLTVPSALMLAPPADLTRDRTNPSGSGTDGVANITTDLLNTPSALLATPATDLILDLTVNTALAAEGLRTEALKGTMTRQQRALATIRDMADGAAPGSHAVRSESPMQIDEELPGPSTAAAAAAPAGARTTATAAPAGSSTAGMRAANEQHTYLSRTMNGIVPLVSDERMQPSTSLVSAWLRKAQDAADAAKAVGVTGFPVVSHLVLNTLGGELQAAASRRLNTTDPTRVITTVEGLMAWVRAWFGVTGDSVRDDAMRALQQQRVRMREGETVIAYHSRFDELLHTAGTGIVSDTYALRQFFFGLTPELRSACATDALGQEWSDIALLVAYAAGKQKAMRASQAHTRTNQGREGQGWKRPNNPNSHGKLHGNPNSHGKLHGNNTRFSHGGAGPSQAQVNVQVGKRTMEDRDKNAPGPFQTVSHQHHQQHGGRGTSGGGASTSGRATGMPQWGEAYCSAFGLCKACLKPPMFVGMESADKLHMRGNGPWVCNVRGATAWPPLGHADASERKLREKLQHNAQRKQQLPQRH
jgi:hypothetical protein